MKRHFLRQLRVFGFDAVEPVILAALISEEPLLLIGKAGTGKTFLLNSLSEALGLEHRHYNASLLSFDDLIGFPAPDASGDAIRFLQTPATIWKAESVLIDEISRCKPEIQNKFFSLIHERRIQGMPLAHLRYRWAAMNPLTMDVAEGADQYEGSIALDQALADRFAFILTVPDWVQLTDEEKEQVINPSGEAAINPASGELINWITGLQKEFRARVDRADTDIILYCRLVTTLLNQGGNRVSPRRARLLARNITAILIAAEALYGSLNDAHKVAMMKLALQWSMPHRAWLEKFPEHAIDAAHAEAMTVIKNPNRHERWLTDFRLQGDLVARTGMLLEKGPDRDTRSLGLIQFMQTGDPIEVAILSFVTLPALEQLDLLNEEALNALAKTGMGVIQVQGEVKWREFIDRKSTKFHPGLVAMQHLLEKLPARDGERVARARQLLSRMLVDQIPVQEPEHTEELLNRCFLRVREILRLKKLNQEKKK
ncbi:MAG: AAA family ATPase [Bacteroidota bacterium]